MADEQETSPALLAMRAIREKHGDARGVAGTIPCTTPKCTGEFQYIVSGYNSHPRGRCDKCGMGFIV